MGRPICGNDGCENLVEESHARDGRVYYRKYCRECFNARYGYKRGAKRWLPNLKCDRCRWEDKYCCRHRIVHGKDGGLYVKENVTSICPNCHQLAHLKDKDGNPRVSTLAKNIAS